MFSSTWQEYNAMQTQPPAQPYYPYSPPPTGGQQGNGNNNNVNNNNANNNNNNGNGGNNSNGNNQQPPAYPPQGGIIGFIPVVFFPCANGTMPMANGQMSSPAQSTNAVQPQQRQYQPYQQFQQQQVHAAPRQDAGDRPLRRRIRGRRAKNNLTDKPIIDVETIIN